MRLPFFVKVVLFCGGFVSLGATLPLSPVPPTATDLPTALRLTDASFRYDLTATETALVAYVTVAERPTATPSELQAVHRRARLAYKRVEHLLAYAQPATVTRHLNGAPLPKTEPNVPEISVIAPGGLQTLDELGFADALDRGSIKKLSQKLLGDYRRLHRQMKALRLQHRHVFESLQQQIVRIFTLGLTGFDTPASGAALAEARVAFSVLKTTYYHYAPLVEQADADLHRALAAALAEGTGQLETEDFDGFDRLAFLRRVVNPLTLHLPQAQKILQIESINDVAGLPSPINPDADYLFSADYLDAGYFANLEDVPTADRRRDLGRLLFFDPILSNDLTASCATCHDPKKAFTDGYAKSPRLTGEGTVLRNSPTLVGAVYAEKYFADLREEFLERQIKHVVVDAHEFATDFVELERRLKRSDEYRALFAAAYPDQPAYQLSKWSISDALTHYLASLHGNDSPFDRYARGETDRLAADVHRGFNLFMGKAACGTCHFAPTFSGLVPPYYQESESEVLGVPATVAWTDAPLDADRGRAANLRPADEVYFNQFAFKTPTVRNVSVTAPYMHNGVYGTLADVMKFYNLGGGAGIGIELDHQTLPASPLDLSDDEIHDVIAFMNSLEDFQQFTSVPDKLPTFSSEPTWNSRAVGGSRQPLNR